MCEWSDCDAEALNGQNISTVKMATSEPVREGQEVAENSTNAHGNCGYIFTIPGDFIL